MLHWRRSLTPACGHPSARVHTAVEATMKMGAEDFSFLSDKFPSCFICLGVEIPGSERFLHTATFDVNEDAIPVGAALLAASALALL